MTHQDSEQQVAQLRSGLTPAAIEKAVQALLRQGEDIGGGINAIRLVRHLLSDVDMDDVETAWAYDQLKPVLVSIFDQIPSLYYFEGD
jgi:hypothetical protein